MQKISCKISNAAQGKTTLPLRLDQAVYQTLATTEDQLSKSLIRKLIIAGAVYVNRKRTRIASRQMHGGEHIEIYLDKNRIPEKQVKEKFTPLRILYEDEALVCFDKPAGLPTQPTLDDARMNLYALAQEELLNRLKKPIYLGMHHRLDRDTSGVILFTKDPRYNAVIAEQFSMHQCTKVYVAVVHGKLKKTEGHHESFLAPVGKKAGKRIFGSVKSGGKKAITDYLVLAQNDTYALVETKIATGRTHQIRVHFSEMGHPVVGDTLYGSPASYYDKLKRHLLHAHTLMITHPQTQSLIRIESPVPEEFRKWVLPKR